MIRLLPVSVQNQIAAGQIIIRPYNVIKQLVENSIDASATQINITIQQGGLKQIKIVDNGCGIMEEDFPLLCVRHATSKIKNIQDLKMLGSFGFRGEALTSLSYGSNLVISSKREKEVIGHSATFKNEFIVGKINQIPMNTGTTILATDLFFNNQRRSSSIGPTQQKARIYELLCHFSLHYPKIKFNLMTQKGIKELPQARNGRSPSEQKMQIFKDITKLSYDKFWYIAPKNIGYNAQVQAIITKLNSCKSKTLLLNINNRIVTSSTLFKQIQKAYSQQYQSIHEQIKTFYVYMSLTVNPNQIDCNIKPSKQQVRLLRSQEICQKIKQLVINQIKFDSAIKTVPKCNSQKDITLYDMIRDKMGGKPEGENRGSYTQVESRKSKGVYSFNKIRTDPTQLPLGLYTQSQQLQGFEESYQQYRFQNIQKDPKMKNFFSQCTYVGCFGLSYILVQLQKKLLMVNMIPLISSFIGMYCQNNKLVIKRIRDQISIQNQLQKFIANKKLLQNSQKVKQWISQQKNQNTLYQIFNISIQNGLILSYPCIGDVFVQCLDLDYKIGEEIAYLVCRVYYASIRGKLCKKLEDKFMMEFLSSQFKQQGTMLSAFNDRINTFYNNKVIPILKLTPVMIDGKQNDPTKYLTEMLDLKNTYKIFQRC